MMLLRRSLRLVNIVFTVTAVLLLSLSTLACARASSDAQTLTKDLTLPQNETTQRYRIDHESHASARTAALKLGVRPPNNWIPRFIRRLAWKLGAAVLSWIHWFDENRTPDSKLSLRVLWWKALASSSRNDGSSKLAYDMLPSGFRLLVSRPMHRFYPRLMHAIMEIRTVYLDRAVMRIAEVVRHQHPGIKIRLVSLGAGYDVRSMQLRERGVIDRAYELDLLLVDDAKTRILTSQCFQKRRPSLVANGMLPELHAVDLNHVEDVKSILRTIIENDKLAFEAWYTIYLFEGVLIYLDGGVQGRLLDACREVLVSSGQQGSLCFADGLENVSTCDEPSGRLELAKHGWKLLDWLPKGGRARHMGCADIEQNPGSSLSNVKR